VPEIWWRMGGRCLLHVGILSEFSLDNRIIKDFWMEVYGTGVKKGVMRVKIFYRIFFDSKLSLVPYFANINKITKINLVLLKILSL